MYNYTMNVAFLQGAGALSILKKHLYFLWEFIILKDDDLSIFSKT